MECKDMIKLIIWDLDGVFWEGSISEGGDTNIDSIVLDFIKKSESLGIIHSICSKNNKDVVIKKLQKYNIWDLFVFPSINLAPKGKRIQEIISNCQLREVNVAYVDDNFLNLNEAKFYCPDILIYDNPSELIQNITLPLGSSRTAQYKILESKQIAKATYYNNEDFLKDSKINIAIAENYECFPYCTRIEELVNRSNQLNYTRTRFDPIGDLNYDIYKNGFNVIQTSASLYILRNTITSFAIFAWDKYGYYGLIGFISVHQKDQSTVPFVNLVSIKACVFSCRIMNMNIESKCVQILKQKYKNLLNVDYRIDDTIVTDYINVIPYQEAESFIRDKEHVVDKKEEKIIILGRCSGSIYKIYSKHKQFIQIECIFSTDKLYHKLHSIDSFPNLIVFMSFVEFLFDYDDYWCLEKNLTQEYFNSVIQHFVELVKISERKLLVFLPNSTEDYTTDIRYLFLYNAWKSITPNNDVTIVEVPLETDFSESYTISSMEIKYTPNIRKFSRKTMHKITEIMDDWINITLF